MNKVIALIFLAAVIVVVAIIRWIASTPIALCPECCHEMVEIHGTGWLICSRCGYKE